MFATVIGSSFQFGYGNAVLNSLELPMKVLWANSGTSAKFGSWTTVWSLTTGFWCIGGMIGALAGGPASNSIGRKWSLIFTNVFTLTGSFLQAYPMGVYIWDASIDGSMQVEVSLSKYVRYRLP